MTMMHPSTTGPPEDLRPFILAQVERLEDAVAPIRDPKRQARTYGADVDPPEDDSLEELETRVQILEQRAKVIER